jgi:hypothetical protein
VALVGDKWEAVGAQFQHPVVFKKIFSHEDVVLNDYFETKQVKTQMVLRYPEFTRFIGRIGRFTPVKEGGGELLRIQEVVPKSEKDVKVAMETYGLSADEVRENPDTPIRKLYAVTGSSRYLWEEASLVQSADELDMRYYDTLVEDALATIGKFGDSTIFTTT